MDMHLAIQPDGNGGQKVPLIDRCGECDGSGEAVWLTDEEVARLRGRPECGVCRGTGHIPHRNLATLREALDVRTREDFERLRFRVSA